MRRIKDIWRKSERIRAGAQVPIAIVGATGGHAADVVRGQAPPPEPIVAIRRTADQELQKQWGQNDLQLRKEKVDRVAFAPPRQQEPAQTEARRKAAAPKRTNDRRRSR